MFDVITIGSAMKDVFLNSESVRLVKSKVCETGEGVLLNLGSKVEVESLVFETGGGGANTAVSFANLGLRTAFFGKIGNDSAGRHILDVLREHKVNTSLALKDKKHTTGYSTIISAKSGDRVALVYRGANSFIKAKEVPLRQFKTRWIYLAPLSGVSLSIVPKLINYCKKNKIKIILNPSSRYINRGIPKFVLKNVNILLLNKEEAARLTKTSFNDEKEILKKLIRMTPAIIAVTDGKKGSLAYTGSKLFKCSSLNVKVATTLGAGDAFCSGFSYGLISGKSIETSMKIGTLNAASVIQHMGATKGLLKKKQITEKLLKKVKVKKSYL